MGKILKAGNLGDALRRFEPPIPPDRHRRIDDSVVVYPVFIRLLGPSVFTFFKLQLQ